MMKEIRFIRENFGCVNCRNQVMIPIGGANVLF